MNTHPDILAKSIKNGGTSLYDHLLYVGLVANKVARETNVDSKLAEQAAFIHDIGKTHPAFQSSLLGKYDLTKIDFRHEIASLFFLPLFPKENWSFLIDMIVAHHRSPLRDLKTQGILDLTNMEGEEKTFERHS
jgi:CRISPR-associated endonuclease/helicase Cas3